MLKVAIEIFGDTHSVLTSAGVIEYSTVFLSCGQCADILTAYRVNQCLVKLFRHKEYSVPKLLKSAITS